MEINNFGFNAYVIAINKTFYPTKKDLIIGVKNE